MLLMLPLLFDQPQISEFQSASRIISTRCAQGAEEFGEGH